MSLAAIIREKIARAGAITLAEFMRLALSHPDYGYYMRRDPFGVRGDFTTAPEISQMFGELLGAWAADAWQRMGSPHAVLVELGAGRGTLMNDALRATRHVAGFHDVLEIHIIEISPTLSAIQQGTLHGAHPRLGWHETMENLPEKPLLLIANEFFDALPIHQYVRTAEGIKERLVTMDETGFCFTLSKEVASFSLPPCGGGLGWGDKPPKNIYSPPTTNHQPSTIIEQCPEAESIMQTIAAHIARHGGAAVCVDYGYTTQVTGDTLQAVKAHHFHPPLEHSGEVDITAHVNFARLKEVAENVGINVALCTQGAFLKQLGIELRAAQLSQKTDAPTREAIAAAFHRLTHDEEMGNLFKVMTLERI